MAELRGDTGEVARLNAAIEARRENVDLLTQEGQLISENAVRNEQYAESLEAAQQAQQTLSSVIDSVHSATSTFIHGLLEGKSAAEAFKAALAQLAQQLLDLALDLLFQSIKQGLLGVIGGGAVGGGLPAYQHGGQFRVGGSGGPDSQLVAFKATPGETVQISNRPVGGAMRNALGSITAGSIIVNVEGSVDDRTLSMMNRMITVAQAKQLSELQRNWGIMTTRYQALRGT